MGNRAVPPIRRAAESSRNLVGLIIVSLCGGARGSPKEVRHVFTPKRVLISITIAGLMLVWATPAVAARGTSADSDSESATARTRTQTQTQAQVRSGEASGTQQAGDCDCDKSQTQTREREQAREASGEAASVGDGVEVRSQVRAGEEAMTGSGSDEPTSTAYTARVGDAQGLAARVMSWFRSAFEVLWLAR